MKQFINAKVILLPTNVAKSEYNQLWLCDRNILYNATCVKRVKSHNETKFQELYIVSDDIIKESDWCLETNINSPKYNTIFKCHNDEKKEYINSIEACNNYNTIKKIIATTDISLNAYHREDDSLTYIYQISQQFIEQFIESYNKGEIITDILIEQSYTINKSMGHFHQFREYKLKINSDNTIIIKPIKDNWNRKQVVILLQQLEKDIENLMDCDDDDNIFNNLNLTEWIEKNLK